MTDALLAADAALGEALYESCKKLKAVKFAAGVASFLCDEIIWLLLPTVMFVGSVCLQRDATAWARLLQEVCLTTAFEEALKGIFCRQRPPYARQSTFTCLPFEHYSFPSGHTLRASFLAVRCAAVLPLLMVGATNIPQMQLAMYVWVLSAAWSRVALGKHFPSDVVVGITIGAFLGQLSSSTLHLIISTMVAPFLLGEAFFLAAFKKYRPKGYFVHVGLAMVGIVAQFFTLDLPSPVPHVVERRIVQTQAVLGPLLIVWLSLQQLFTSQAESEKEGSAYLKLED
jgi:membrane-associated phospholipid phosphatase